MNVEYNLKEIKTPAFICDIDTLIKNLEFHRKMANESGCKLLFSLKTFTIVEILKYIQKYVDGFSSSSLFETKIAKELLSNEQSIHLTTPGLRQNEINEISRTANFIAFNSISQYEFLKDKLDKNLKIGFRINPQFSSDIDNKYNPCCPNSKLGIPIKRFVEYIKTNNYNFVTGIHFHTNCDSTNFDFLTETFELIEINLKDCLHKIEWINLGGGYLFQSDEQIKSFINLIKRIKNKYDVEIYIEPGASIIRNSFLLVSTVIYVFDSEDKRVAVLDRTVNHLPEVLEFNYRLNITNSSKNGAYEYILAGSSCLAGDLFGLYKFDKPLKIGDKILFNNVGAYSIVKSNMFNGINLPAIYQTHNDTFKLIKEYTYYDFIGKYN